MSEFCASISLYSNVALSLMLVVTSGIGYSYFSTDLSFFNCSVNHEVMFGCGIGVGILIFFINFFASTCLTYSINLWSTLPIYIILCSLYITYTIDDEFDACMVNAGKEWKKGISEINEIRKKYKCCGWENATHYGSDICPFEYQSSCKKVIADQLKPKMRSLMICSSILLGLFTLTTLILQLILCLTDNSTPFEMC